MNDPPLSSVGGVAAFPLSALAPTSPVWLLERAQNFRQANKEMRSGIGRARSFPKKAPSTPEHKCSICTFHNVQ